MSWCKDAGKTEILEAVKYGRLSIKSLSKNGKIHPRHCSTAFPNAEKNCKI